VAATAGPDGSAVDHYELRIDGAKDSTVLAADCSSTCSTQPSSSLSDGSHTWQISAVDTAGNVRDSTHQRSPSIPRIRRPPPDPPDPRRAN
jgi:hypothetical protein